jgi:hypothetical protein
MFDQGQSHAAVFPGDLWQPKPQRSGSFALFIKFHHQIIVLMIQQQWLMGNDFLIDELAQSIQYLVHFK